MAEFDDRTKQSDESEGIFERTTLNLRLAEFLRHIPDEKLGEIFGSSGLAGMEAAMIERSLPPDW